jgi:hypothetical protein
MKKHLSAQARTVAVAAIGLAITLSATVTHAGFQWVPPTGQEKAPSAADNSAPPAEAVPTGDVQSSVLPMPGEATSVPAQPQLKPADAVPAQTLQLPPNYQGQMAPGAAPASAPVMKTKVITPPVEAANTAPAAPQEPLPLLDAATPPPAPVMQQPLAQPPHIIAAPAPAPAPMAPVVTQTKVIMPDDAPQNAMDNTPNSERLVINPYPTGNAMSPAPVAAAPMPVPQAIAPVPAPASDFAVVEGFGSDMPLALALQQIIPPGYATSFDQSVNPGTIVSWDGGKPWDQIINDMIAPAKLEANVEGKVVHIRQQGTGQRAEAQPMTQEELVRRDTIKDPGDAPQQQAVNSLAGIESAAGTPTDEPVASEKLPLPPTAAETAAAAAPAQPEIWNAKAGESLKETLTRWSDKAGVELIWMASYDYKIKTDISVENNFDGAIQSIANATDAESGPSVQVMKNDQGTTGRVVIKDRT